MKRIITLFLLFISITTQGQVWVDHGATWYYDWSGFLPAFDKIEYVGDTIIQSKNCQKLKTTGYKFAPAQYGGDLINTYYGFNFTHVSGDTVFYLVNGSFHILYNFGAHVGDRWDLGIDTNQTWCTHSLVEVQSTGSTLINGQSCEWISVITLPYSSAGLSGKIYKRFGAVDDYLFPTPRNCDSAIVEWNDYNFSCFEDDSFTLYNVTNNDCDYLFHVGLDEIEPTDYIVSIFPNPFIDKITLQLPETLPDINLSIYDVYSRLVSTTNYSNTNIITLQNTNLPKGIYFYRLTSKNFIVKTGKIIKN